MNRAEQRDQTRARIIEAAVAAFAEHGFAASSTRDIAARAGVTQGLVSYHFTSKDELWRAAADRIFGELGGDLPERPETPAPTPGAGARHAIAAYVRFAALHPEFFHFMIDAGRRDDDRMRWLVEQHLAPRFAEVAAFAQAAFPDGGPELAPHVYYALAGAASVIFTVAPECAALTGVEPLAPAEIDRHVDLVVRLFLGEPISPVT
jgi:TetR/AcrR family transcriptional regulator